MRRQAPKLDRTQVRLRNPDPHSTRTIRLDASSQLNIPNRGSDHTSGVWRRKFAGLAVGRAGPWRLMRMSAVKTALAVVVLSMAALTACGTTSGVNSGAAMTSAGRGDPEAILRTRASFEDAQRQYRASVQNWATQIAASSPGLSWRVKEDSWGRMHRRVRPHTRGPRLSMSSSMGRYRMRRGRRRSTWCSGAPHSSTPLM